MPLDCPQAPLGPEPEDVCRWCGTTGECNCYDERQNLKEAEQEDDRLFEESGD